MNKYNKCRCCNSKNIKPWLSLPDSPIANALYSEPNDQRYELKLNYCLDCGHLQLESAPEPEGVFKDYKYRSGVSAIFRKHFDKYAKTVANKVSGKLVLEIGSNDGYLLSKFKELGWDVVGVEPSSYLVEEHKKYDIPLFVEFFTSSFAQTNSFKNKCDLICANNVLAHIPDSYDIMKGIYACLKPGGVLIAECGHQSGITTGKYLDNVYHEHLDYYTPYSFAKLCERAGLKVKEIEKIDMHGVSFRAYVYKEKGKSELPFEQEDLPALALKVSKHIESRKAKMNKLLKDRKFVAYGSAAKAVTSLYTLGLINQVETVIDDNELKQNCYFPGTSILIKPSSTLKGDELIVVTAWNVFKDIKKKLVDNGHTGEIICMQ